MHEHTHASPRDRVYAAFWQDGSIDLFAGLAMCGVAVAWLFDQVALGPIAPAAAIPLWVAFRRRAVEPRLGRVRFDAPRRRRLERGHAVLLVVGCATLALAVVAYFALGGTRPHWLRDTAPALPGVLVGLAAAISALMFAIPRLAFYSLPFVLGGVVVALLDVDPGWSLLAGGVVTTVAGGVLLARFTREFPLLSNELD